MLSCLCVEITRLFITTNNWHSLLWGETLEKLTLAFQLSSPAQNNHMLVLGSWAAVFWCLAYPFCSSHYSERLMLTFVGYCTTFLMQILKVMTFELLSMIVLPNNERGLILGDVRCQISPLLGFLRSVSTPFPLIRQLIFLTVWTALIRSL